MAEGPKWTENALQRLRAAVGQEGEEEIIFSSNALDGLFRPKVRLQFIILRRQMAFQLKSEKCSVFRTVDGIL